MTAGDRARARLRLTQRQRTTLLQPRWLSGSRIGVGLLFTEHGPRKLFDFPPPTIPLSIGDLVFPGLPEAGDALLVALRPFTRPVDFELFSKTAISSFRY